MAEAKCRMKGCGRQAEAFGFCVADLELIRTSKRWLPLKVLPVPDAEDETVTMTVCGLCGTPVWALKRLDNKRGEIWAIETDSVEDGRCHIVDGGFWACNDSRRDELLLEHIPLFRAHSPVCEERAKITA